MHGINIQKTQKPVASRPSDVLFISNVRNHPLSLLSRRFKRSQFEPGTIEQRHYETSYDQLELVSLKDRARQMGDIVLHFVYICDNVAVNDG